jgi:biopolymer transport protein TolQ
MNSSTTTTNLEQVVSTASNVDLSIMTLILSADLVGKLVILTLILASIWSWGIIINKLIGFNVIKAKMSRFENLFWSGQVLDDLYEKVQKSIDNPLSSIFINALNECKKHKTSINTAKSDSLKIGYKERVIQAMYLAKNRELERLENKLGFLATVGSAAPFIGLFGTVWGIMHSFQSIAASKNTTLAVVAPGIAEALLATAIGLFAAIPAVIFYNFLASSVDNIHNRADDFIGELTALLTRAIDEEKM